MSRKKRFIIMISFIIIASIISMYLMYESFLRNRDNASYNIYDYLEKDEKLLDYNETHKVLFISSYSPSFETFNDQLRGIKSILNDKYANIDVEFMDTKRFNTEENIINFYESLSYKLSHTESYDGIIVADDNALSFILKYYEELFAEIPIVFLGINNIDLAYESANIHNITGVIESASIDETIEIAYSINTDAKRVVALVDNTPSGQADLELLLSSQNKIPSLEYSAIDLSKITFDDFIDEINHLTEDDIVLLLSVYKDANGITLSFNEGVRLVLENCNQPIYHPYLHGMGDGILGGKIISHYDQGASAAILLERVFNSENIDSIEVVSESPNIVIFDYNVMKAFDITTSQLPEDTIIINQPKVISEQFIRLSTIIVLILLQLIVIFLLGININRRNKAESNFEKFKLISDKALNGHMITDMNDQIIYCNDYYAKAHGYNSNELINEHSRIFHTGDQWTTGQKFKTKLIDDNFLEPIEIGHKRKNGEKFTMLVSGIVFFDTELNKNVLVYNAIDNTHIKLLKEEKEAAVSATKEKSQFLANMSHEIRTPLNAIVGFNDLLGNTDLSEKQKDYSKKIYGSAKSLLGIINDILDFSRIESGKLIIEQTEVNIKELVSKVIDSVLHISSTKGIEISSSIDKDTPDILIGDPLRLEQVLLNLISNAVKFTENGLVNIDVNVLSEKDDIYKIKFIIKDSGIGMTKDQVDNLFKPFTQADSSTTRKYGGSGLGLAISRNLVKMMGGNIKAKSTYGKGSEFSFTLKLKKSKVSSINQELDLHNDGLDIKGIAVLLVEDNEINQMVAQELLELKGFSVDTANNGKEAIEKLTNEKSYDVILMDLQMPIMDGYEATKIIRSELKLKEIPIIALSADAMEGTELEAKRAGMNDYITKPIEPKLLYSKIYKIVNEIDEH